jgi:4-amino-4-deoxy-L-arabinose transferase-like glycosyltransferase
VLTSRLSLIAPLALAAALMASLLVIHSDDNDGATYTVIARHLAHDGTPFSLRFLSQMYPRFYEHPPLWLWLQALLSAVLPPSSLSLLGFACGLGALGAAFVIGRELLSERAAFYGCALLALTEAFFHWMPTARLDPPLVLCFTVSVALLITARGRLALLVAGALVAGLGSLVKGPPALGAPFVAALSLALAGRRAELKAPHVAAVGAVAIAPAALFFLYDHLALGGAWWAGYVRGQFLASALGARGDGRGHLYLLRTVAGRFWPGLPFAALALVRPRPERLALLGWAVLVVSAFSTASRSFWWYALPAFVPLALLAGAGLDDLLARWDAERAAHGARRLILGAAIAVAAVLPLHLGRFLVQPCRFDGLAAAAAARSGSEQPLGLVSQPPDWPGQAVLAEHTDRDVVVFGTLAEVPAEISLVFVETAGANEGWAAVGSVGEVRLLERAATASGPSSRP